MTEVYNMTLIVLACLTFYGIVCIGIVVKGWVRSIVTFIRDRRRSECKKSQ